jgi:hypothetical protein
MASMKDTTINKDVWCIPTYATLLKKKGYKISNVGYCRYGDNCRGAHNHKEIKKRHDITKWETRDKSNINLSYIQDNVIETIKSSYEYVINPKYRSQIQNIDSLRFDNLLHFWFDITCYHRRIFKSDKIVFKKQWTDKQSKPPALEGFHFKDDVPQFKLNSNIEDDVWLLERTLRMCEKHDKLCPIDEISIKDLCCGDINCKEGVHNVEDLVCIDNMLYGECKCPTFEQNEQLKQDYIKQGMLIKTKNNNNLTIEEQTDLTHQYNQIVKKYKKIEKYVRLVHLTEMGIIPLSVRLTEKELTAPKTADNIEIKHVNRIFKPGNKGSKVV